MKPTKETYYYPRNAQGDAVKLIDKTGATVVEYTYDTWGKPFMSLELSNISEFA